MIYTGYFAKNKQYTEAGLQVVSIASKTPSFFKGPKYSPLSPNYEMLMSWKEDRIDNFQFTSLFKEQLEELDKEEVRKFLSSFDKDVILLCYEKPTDFCHRHIVADWLEENLHVMVEEYDQALKNLEIDLIETLTNGIYSKEQLDEMFHTNVTQTLLNIGSNPPEGYFLLRDKDLNTDEYIYTLENIEQYLTDYGIAL